MRRTLSYYILANKTARKYLQKQTHRETEGLSLRPLYQTSPSIMEENDVAGSVTEGFQQESRLPLSLFLSLCLPVSPSLHVCACAQHILWHYHHHCRRHYQPRLSNAYSTTPRDKKRRINITFASRYLCVRHKIQMCFRCRVASQPRDGLIFAWRRTWPSQESNNWNEGDQVDATDCANYQDLLSRILLLSCIAHMPV